MSTDVALAVDATATGTNSGLQALLAPRGVVVIGASTDPDKLGGAMAAALGSHAEAGHEVLLVNPRGGAGMHPDVATAVASASEPVDLAVLCIPAPACADAVAACADAGVRAALICAGGFSEVGGAGVEAEQRLVEVARERGIRILGPNTSGFFVPATGLRASFVPGAAELEPGHVAVVAASGGLNHALAFALERRGVGISLGIGIGAGLDVTAPDVLEHLGTHNPTRAVALHLETVEDGPRLLDAVRSLTRTTPVVALVVGQHDIGDFARSHTGALATSWRTTRALLRDAGAVVVDDEDQLVTAAAALAHTRLAPAAHPGVGLVTAQAGPGLLVTDALHDAAVDLPELGTATRERLAEVLPPMTYQANPVDTGRPGPRHGDVLSAVASDPSVDLVAVYGLAEPVVDLPGAVGSADLGGVPCVVGLDGLRREVDADRATARARGVLAVVGPTALATSVAALVTDARQQEVAGTDPRDGDTPRTPVLLDQGPWTEADAKDVLGRVGIATPPRLVCDPDDSAVDAAASLGWPVAAKISDADVVHKSERGGVHLGLADRDSVQDAVHALAAVGARKVLIERMSGPGVDLVVGARRDPVFGPVVLVGVGGVATEVYADVAIAPATSPAHRFETLPDELEARVLLDGFRGGPVVDRTALSEVCAALGRLLVDNPHLDEVEINPLRATHDGLMALDAVLLGRPDPVLSRDQTPTEAAS